GHVPHPPRLPPLPVTRPPTPLSPHFGTGPAFTALWNRARSYRTSCRAPMSPQFLPRPDVTAVLAAWCARRGPRDLRLLGDDQLHLEAFLGLEVERGV